MAHATSSPSAFEAGPRTLALWVVLAAQLMLQMDFLIVIVALPRIQHELGFTAAGLSWVPNAFALAFGGLLLLGGRLGDLMGQVRAFRYGLGLFIVASLWGGLAHTSAGLIGARVLQGMGAALAGPSVLALVTLMARTEQERARGLSLFIAASSIGASAGLILGGVLTDFLSWRWSLLINVPLGIAVVAAVGRLVHETQSSPARLDLGGAATGTAGSAALVYGFIHAAEQGWGSTVTLLSFVAALALLTIFLMIERRHPAPVLKLGLLRNRQRAAGLVVMALIVGMHFSLIFTLVQYLQQVLGLNPLMAGLAYVPLTAMVFVITHFVPGLMGRFGPRTLLIAGSVLVALSLVLFARLGADSSYLGGVLVPLIIHATGIALVFAPGTVTIMEAVPEADTGAASGLLQMDQQIGGALGIAIVASIHAMSATPGNFVSGLSAAFITGSVIAALAGVVAATLPRRAGEAGARS